MKRPNGSGSVIKLAGNRRKPYAAVITAGWNPETGRRIAKYIGYYATYQDAETALVTYRLHPVEKSAITWEALYVEWRAIHVQEWSKQLTDNYNSAWQYLKPLHSLKVKDTRTAQMQRIIDTASYIPPHKAGERVKPVKAGRSTLEKIRSLMKQLSDYAVQNDIIEKNYAAFVRLPKKDKVEKEHFTELEVKKIRDAAAAGIQYADCIYMLIMTGLRISEFLELTTFSVDLSEGVLRGGLKTDAGKNRVVPLHASCMPYFSRWVSKGGEKLICKQAGSGWSASSFRRNCYYPALEKIGVRALNPHCCRHTFASMLAAANVPTLEIQKLMGHTDYSFTADTYTHIDTEPLKKAIAAL